MCLVASVNDILCRFPLEGVLDGEGAGEELVALLVHLGGAVGIEVFVKEIPHVVGEGEDLEVLGVSKQKHKIKATVFTEDSKSDKCLSTITRQFSFATYWNPVLNFWAADP